LENVFFSYLEFVSCQQLEELGKRDFFREMLLC